MYLRRVRAVALIATLCFSAVSLTACDSGGDKPDAKKAETKTAEAKKAGDAKADAKAADAKAEPKKKEVEFDISVDKSGELARMSSVLETSEQISKDDPLRGHLAEVSHHAEQGESNEQLCKRMATILGDKAGAPEECALVLEHERMILGPEIFKQMEQCIKDSKDTYDLHACEEAEKKAEKMLHEQKHGDGLSKEDCEKLFNHFEKLSMEDAGNEAEAAKKLLEDNKAEALSSCQDQGTKAELECALKAKNMEEVGKCHE